MTTTTIKVPTTLRDRLARRTHQGNVSLAAVIGQALDALEEKEFWDAVRRDHARLTEGGRQAYVSDPTASDDL